MFVSLSLVCFPLSLSLSVCLCLKLPSVSNKAYSSISRLSRLPRALMNCLLFDNWWTWVQCSIVICHLSLKNSAFISQAPTIQSRFPTQCRAIGYVLFLVGLSRNCVWLRSWMIIVWNLPPVSAWTTTTHCCLDRFPSTNLPPVPQYSSIPQI